MESNYISLDIPNSSLIMPPPCISFHIDLDDWCIEIKEDGIKFNHEKYPEWLADDFAKAFLDLLEKNYDVTFERRECKTDLQ